MIVVGTDDLLVRVDPAHGGEILDLIVPRAGAQYVGRPPLGSLPPRSGDIDEDTWTGNYRGGWQTVRRGQSETLRLESASVPPSLGLARAVAEGQAHRVEPDADQTCSLVPRPLDGATLA